MQMFVTLCCVLCVCVCVRNSTLIPYIFVIFICYLTIRGSHAFLNAHQTSHIDVILSLFVDSFVALLECLFGLRVGFVFVQWKIFNNLGRVTVFVNNFASNYRHFFSFTHSLTLSLSFDFYNAFFFSILILIIIIIKIINKQPFYVT